MAESRSATGRTARVLADARSRPAAGRVRLRTSWPSVIAAATVLVLAGALAFASGGYFPTTHLTAGIVAFAVLGALLVVRPPTYAFSSSALVALATLGAYVAWVGLSSTWSPQPDVALQDFQRGLVYLGLFGLALLAAGSGRVARHVLWAALGVISLIGVVALVSRLEPDLLPGSQVSGLGSYRLSYPFSYWNALGALTAMGAVLATGLAADPTARVPWRAGAAGAAVLLAVTMYLSLSRGAWIGLIAGGIVLAVSAAHRGSLLLTAAVVVTGSVAAVGRLTAYDALVEDPLAGAGQAAAGDAYAPQLLVVLGLVVAAQGAIAAGRATPAVMTITRRVGTPLALGVAALLVLGATGTYAVAGGDVEEAVGGRVTDAEDWVEEQWDEFNRPASFSASGTERLSSARTSRAELYRVAREGFAAHPWRGDGAGGFEVRWNRERELPEDLRDGHSLLYETLGELGLVGTALLAAFLVAVLAAVARARRRPGALRRAQAAAIAGAFTAWLVHAGVDWDWEMPGLTAFALVIGACAFPEGRRRGGRRSGTEHLRRASGRPWYRAAPRAEAAEDAGGPGPAPGPGTRIPT